MSTSRAKKSLIAVLGLACTMLFATFGHAATFKIATLSPDGSAWMKLLRKHAKQIEERTGGEVKFKFYPGGVMGDDKAVMRKMRVGQLHGAVLTAGGLVGVYPDIVMYNLPMIFEGEDEVDYVRAKMDGKLMAGLRDNKFVGFGIAEVGFAYPMMKQRVASVGEFRQRKIWTPDNDPGSLIAFDAFKISPIPLPIADVLAGLQTGLIDVIASPPVGAIALQWYTQVDYGIDIPLMYVYGLFTIAQRPFERLNDKLQQIVAEELGNAVATVNAGARRDHNSAKAAILNQGIEWVKPQPQVLQEWRQLAATSRDALVDDGYVSRELYQELASHLQAYRATDQ